MDDFSQWSLSIEGIPVESRLWRDDKTGTAKLFDAAAEMRKIIGGPHAGGKIGLSEKTARGILVI